MPNLKDILKTAKIYADKFKSGKIGAVRRLTALALAYAIGGASCGGDSVKEADKEMHSVQPVCETQYGQKIQRSEDDKWIFVFTYTGTNKLPDQYFETFCSDIRTKISAWLDSEAREYGLDSLMPEIECYPEQVKLPDGLANGPNFCGPDGCVPIPINQEGTIQYIDSLQGIAESEYVTIFYHTEDTAQFYNNAEMCSKYSFVYLHPAYLASGYSFDEIITHEFMHNNGATDKYGDGNLACAINPETGHEYDNHDIMCHMVKDGDGFSTLPLEDLVVSDPTAREIGWE